ncbi:FtsX-like permease family protein [Mucilaginibacter limnophilus]|uniref:FtsX-like permease family protein n=1 Tax=Mucilaginibacter limnophilus TaxID=1932778 RepID=A0A3S2VAD7_9SPHI|nr:ABC transporter permease [Mucilaginibacter limnophilus]RVU02741.1 FtsX-like permease family protein [Mucilaginibacter limnophilus]
MFKNYLKIAWRNLLKNKGFTFINVSGLTIGMASAALILFWINHEVGYDQFHEKKDRLYTMYNKAVFDGQLWCWNTTPKIMAKTLRDYPQVEEATHTTNCFFLFNVGEKKLNVSGMFTDSGFLKMFTFPALKGNPNTALNDIYSIVVTQKLAKKLFGTEDALGKTIRLDSVDNFRVTAVLKDIPDNSRFKFEYLLPWQYMKKIGQDDEYWGNNSVQTYALLKAGVTEAAANKQIKDITRSHSDQKETDVFLHPIKKWRLYSKFENGINTGGRITTIRVFGVIAIFILVIACINFMNLSTARSEKRAKEVGIRKVSGAPRGFLIGQFLAESIMISLIAGILALIIVYVSLPAFNQLTEKELFIPYADPYFWLAFFGFVILTGVIAGSYPAFYLSSFNPVKVLKGTFKAANALVTPRKALVVFQFMIAIGLIICTIIIKNQLKHAQDRDTGYKKDNLVYTFISGEIDKHYKLIREELISSGAAVSVTKTSAPITQGWSDSWGYDWQGKDPNAKIDLNVFNVDGDFTKTMGLKIVAGRDIDVKNFPTDTSAVLLNEASVKTMGFKDPIGQIITQDGGNRKWTVVGVVKDFILQSPYEPVKGMIIQGPRMWFNVIHYKLNPANTTSKNLKLAEAVFKKYNPDYPFDYKFIDEDYATKFADEQRTGTLATLFAGLTIFISCLGLFGLATYMAQNRVKEIGVRKVLGASVGRITALLSADFLKLVIISFAIAAPLAWYFMKEYWLNTYTYRIDISIWVFIISGLLTIAIALLTISFQTIKAAIANPVKSLRSE